MVKVIVTELSGNTRKAGKKTGAVASKRVRDANGQMVTLRTVDVESGTYGQNLTYVFGKNVAKARDENKRLTGHTDVRPAKQ